MLICINCAQITMFVVHGLPTIGTTTLRIPSAGWIKADTNLQLTMFDTIVLPMIFEHFAKIGKKRPRMLLLQSDRGFVFSRFSQPPLINSSIDSAIKATMSDEQLPRSATK
jgi:hypothetical protein